MDGGAGSDPDRHLARKLNQILLSLPTVHMARWKKSVHKKHTQRYHERRRRPETPPPPQKIIPHLTLSRKSSPKIQHLSLSRGRGKVVMVVVRTDLKFGLPVFRHRLWILENHISWAKFAGAGSDAFSSVSFSWLSFLCSEHGESSALSLCHWQAAAGR